MLPALLPIKKRAENQMFSTLKGGNENVAVFKYNIAKNIIIKHDI